MKIFFNPYPKPLDDEASSLKCTLVASDALIRLTTDTRTQAMSDVGSTLSAFTLVCDPKTKAWLGIKELFHRAEKRDLEKLRWLLAFFSKGLMVDVSDEFDSEGWTISGIGLHAPILEYAAKDGSAVFTIPTLAEWAVDRISFDGHELFAHNCWGQEDVSPIRDFYFDSIAKSAERFAAKFNAVYCAGVLSEAPDERKWDEHGFFRDMARAEDRGYSVDGYLVKRVDDTKYGVLLELRCRKAEWRIFFVVLESRKVCVAGFYQKGNRNQGAAIAEAVVRVDGGKWGVG